MRGGVRGGYILWTLLTLQIFLLFFWNTYKSEEKRREQKPPPIYRIPAGMAPETAPRPFPTSTIEAISRSGRGLRSSQHPLPSPPGLRPLRNPIHPLFHQGRFPKLAPHLHETLAPTLRLATKFLTAEGMLDWWVPLFLSPLPPPPQDSSSATAKTKGKPKAKKNPAARPTLSAIPVTPESLRDTASLLAAHADSVEFRFVAADEAGTMDGAFASTHLDPRPGKEGKALVFLGQGWLEGVVEEWEGRKGEETRVRIEDKEVKVEREVKVGDEERKVRVEKEVKVEKEGRVEKEVRMEKDEEEEERRLRVRVALAILLVHEVAHSVWVVRNATLACTTLQARRPSSSNLASDTLRPLVPNPSPTNIPSAPTQIPLEPYHHALESAAAAAAAELGCSWEAFALSGGRIQPVNLSPRCEDGLCWFAWPEPRPAPSSSLKRRPKQLLVPPDRDTDPRYAAYDRERADRRSRAENERAAAAAAEYGPETRAERFWGVTMGWVREVCDRDKWDWVELFGAPELRVRLLGDEGDGSGATCPFSPDGWTEKRKGGRAS